MPTYVENKRAHFDYYILETYEAGIELIGFEVKAIRGGHMNLMGAFVVPRANELYLTNATVSRYQPQNTPRDYNPERSRRLLLHRNEIATLIGKSRESGLTLIPIRVYSKRRHIKLLLGVARRKKKLDKREAIKKRYSEREIQKATSH
ncbi:MAG: SsrA-binding protein SmpB [Candidatus Sungbacteria bacterium]|uniref:SsrA-binding protein n=1 Tax=Candidatus Sungiibacteriota bacterium TaxID=2750080 RepID=A0A9D6LS72_9BACT|nr:SsrA-binding protein SmpB [Candidatus Sungbacteria bacterium]